MVLLIHHKGTESKDKGQKANIKFSHGGISRFTDSSILAGPNSPLGSIRFAENHTV